MTPTVTGFPAFPSVLSDLLSVCDAHQAARAHPKSRAAEDGAPASQPADQSADADPQHGGWKNIKNYFFVIKSNLGLGYFLIRKGLKNSVIYFI